MKHRQALILLAAGLWAMHGLVLTAQVVLPDAAAKLADVAHDKSVVWLSLFTACLAILFSAWLVNRMLLQWEKGVAAIVELKKELENRPCFANHTPRA